MSSVRRWIKISSVLPLLFQISVLFGQEISHPIGAQGPVNSLNHWNNQLILTSSRDQFGKPMSGLDTINPASGKIAGRGHTLNGTVQAALQTDAGVIYLSGADLVVNGQATRSQLTRIEPDGTLDTSMVHHIEFHDRSYKPWRWQTGNIQSMLLKGDTLFVAGRFSRINGKMRYGVAAFDARSMQLLDWKLNLNYANYCNLKQLGDTMYVYGSFTHFNGGYQPFFLALDLHSKRALETVCPESLIEVLEGDDKALYLNGYFGKIGNPVSKALLTSGWNFHNELALPYMDHALHSGTVNAVVEDSKKGYFVGGVYDEVLDTTRRGLYYFDSLNRIQDVPMSYGLGDVYHLDFFNDTLLIVAYSADTAQRLHYFDTKNWRQIACPIQIGMGNDAEYSTFGSYGENQYILSKVLAANGKALYGSVLFHRASGNWQWLPPLRSFDYNGDTLFFVNQSSLNQSGYETGPISYVKPNDTIPGMIARFQSSIQAITPDGKGGYYLAGDIPGIYEKIVHVLPDGTEDLTFDFRMWQSSTIKDMVLVGDTLFVAGDFSSQWTIPTGSLILIDVARNQLIRNAIAVKDEISDLLLIGDTLFLAGKFTSINNDTKYSKLAALNVQSLLPFSWLPGMYGNVSSIDTGGSFLYATGLFDSCLNFPYPHLTRFNRRDLGTDTGFHFSFVRNHTSQIPTYYKVKTHLNRLYLAGKTNWAKVEGKQVAGVVCVDLQGDSIVDLDLRVSHYDNLYDMAFTGDTMYLAGSFLSIRNAPYSYIAALTLSDRNPFKRFPKPNAQVRKFFLESDKLWFMGDFMKLDNHDGDYFKYDMRTRKFLPVPNYGLDGSQLTILNNAVFVADRNRLIGGFQYKALYKFNKSNNELQKWVPEFATTHPSASISLLTHFGDTLCISGSGFSSTSLGLPPAYRDIVLAIDPDSGKLHHGIIFDLGVNQLRVRRGKLLITGSFNFSNYHATSMAKLTRKTLNIDLNFKNSLRTSALYPYRDHVWGLNGNLVRFNALNGRDTTILSITKSGESISRLIALDSILHLYGTFNSLRHVKYNPYSNTTLNIKDLLSYNLDSDITGESNLKFSFYPPWKVDGNKLIAQVPGSGGIGILTEPIREGVVMRYDAELDRIHPVKLGVTYGTQAFSKVSGDKLYVANARLYLNNKYVYGILEYDLKRDTLLGELNGTSECNDFVMYNGKIIQVGDFTNGLRIYDINQGTLLSGTPQFNAQVWTIYIKDSIAYIGGEFDKVNNQTHYGLVKMNLNTYSIIPFKTPYPRYCKVRKILGKGRYIVLAGDNVEPGSSNWLPLSVLDTEFESLYPNRPVCNFEKVNSMSFVQNRLILNVGDYSGEEQETRVYNFVTGLQLPEFKALGLKEAEGFRQGSSLWVYGQNQNVTAWSKNYIARIDGDVFDLSMKVDEYAPKKMAIDKSARMRIIGYGFTENTYFYLQKDGTKYHPIDSTLAVDQDGFQLSGVFSNTGIQTGVYDLIVYEPGLDTVQIDEAIEVDTAKAGSIQILINGRDTVRSQRWTTCNFQIINTANYDLYNVPFFLTAENTAGIKIRELIERGDGLLFDTETLSVSTDQILGNAVSGNTAALLIREVPAESGIKLSIAVKSSADAEDMALYTWCNGPLSSLDNLSKVLDAYAELMGVSNKNCLDSIWNDFDKLNGLDYRSGRKQAALDFKFLLGKMQSRCAATSNENELIRKCIPHLEANLKAYSDKSYTDQIRDGSRTFLDTVLIKKELRVVNSLDPNVKIGFKGYSDKNFASTVPEELFYSIHFENDSTATAPVQKLVITDSLDALTLYPESVHFTELVLGDRIIQFTEGSKQIDEVFELSKSDKYLIHVRANVDLANAVMTCTVTALDRLTRDADELGPFDGFLFPNKGAQNGEGYLSFYIKRKTDAVEVRNAADIVFDNNKALRTPVWEVNRDDVLPESRITNLQWNENTMQLDVEWEGEDVGSGVKEYSIYISANAQDYTEAESGLSVLTTSIPVQNDATYYLYSVATDFAGNVEVKSTFDLSIKLGTGAVSGFDKHPIGISPNPSSGKFTIHSAGESFDLSVFDVTGRLVYSQNSSGGSEFRLTQSGIYFARLQSGSWGDIVFKLVVTE